MGDQFYNFAVSIASIQGVCNFIIFINKPLRRYAYTRKFILIQRFKKNEKKAKKSGVESLENCQILDSLNHYDNINYNSHLNIITLTLFQLVGSILFNNILLNIYISYIYIIYYELISC